MSKLFGIPSGPWLYPEEQQSVVEQLLTFGLLKFDNRGMLPLRSGGTTDIYVNLRLARNTPRALRYLTELYAIPLRRLKISRFVEIPHAVSCIAGPLAIEANLPFLTVREEKKEGRVSDAQIIGDFVRGERVVLMDDVVTSGGSSILPYQVCCDRGLDLQGLIVLVDRQQGWKKTFELNAVCLSVWPGMTLHDVRRILIRELGVMERCRSELETANPIILALDNRGWDELLPIVDTLRTTGCIIKVNDFVFDNGFRFLPELQVYGRVMVDLKGHDIPETVRNTCRRLSVYQPWAVTVHASGNAAMVAAAKEGLGSARTLVLAVTVLTSFTEQDCLDVYARPPMKQVEKLADLVAVSADGFVCSPLEAEVLRKKYPGKVLVTPGVRSPGAEKHDQARVDTIEAALRHADYLVGGRQFLRAPDPVAEVRRVLVEELNRPTF